jgi:hypothetical protein
MTKAVVPVQSHGTVVDGHQIQMSAAIEITLNNLERVAIFERDRRDEADLRAGRNGKPSQQIEGRESSYSHRR